MGTDWVNDDAARITEATVVDAMGNRALRTSWPPGEAFPPRDSTRYEAGTGRVSRMFAVPPTPPDAGFQPDTTLRQYDGAGNVTWGCSVGGAR